LAKIFLKYNNVCFSVCFLQADLNSNYLRISILYAYLFCCRFFRIVIAF
jgi:hypothetical protein